MNSSPAKILSALFFTSLLIAMVGIQPGHAASLVVNTSADNTTSDGFCSLREAITNANNDSATYPDCAAGAGADIISFAANYTITLIGTQLPAITSTITINGSANTILQANTNPNMATYRVLEVANTGNLTINNLTVRHGRCNGACPTSASSGGGIFNSGTLAVTNSTLSSNSAGSFGGGISNSGTLAVTNSTLSANSAPNGGGIYNGHILTVTNSTLFANSAPSGFGGGIGNGGTLTVTNSTLFANSAPNGGGIYHQIGAATLYNSIVANSPSGFNCAQAGAGTFAADSNNLDTDGSCDNATQRTTAEINLQLLANNGGPTQTMALGTGSLAIDAGNAAICANAPVSGKDQRGVTRPQGTGCDVGAYELDNTYPTVVSDSLVASYSIGPDSFTVTFSENVYDPAGNIDADDATNSANYRIVEDGANGSFNTASCTGGLVTDDTQVTVNSVAYNPATFTSTVNINSGVALPVGRYRLFVCGTTSIVDIAFNPLNDGASDYTFDFVVTAPDVSLPDTGFAPNRVTSLPAQAANSSYASLGDIWLEIPSLNIETSIVGVPKSNGNWNVEWLGQSTGWLHGTAFPTWQGNAVLTGHVYNSNGLPGPFFNIKNLKYGDTILIHLFGERYIFEVQSTRLARPTSIDFALQHLEDYSYLTLITCQGYNPLNDSYLFRRIVRAVLVEVQSE